MKLTSTARLRIVTVALTTILTAGIGTFAAVHTHDRDQGSIDRAISETVRAASDNPNQELSASLYYLDQYSLDLSLYLLSRDGQLTTVSTFTNESVETFSISEAKRALGVVVSDRANNHLRFKSLEISGGDFLIVAGSTLTADATLTNNLQNVGVATLATNIVAFLFLSFYIRRIKARDDRDALHRMQEFLGDASHELRTPLTVVKGYVEMLSKSMIVDESDRQRAFQRVTTEITRMESLIHDLLLLAELGESAGRNYEKLNLSELFQSHLDDFALLNPSRRVDVEIDKDLEIESVRDYLSRFIQNALNNIARHTPADAPVRAILRESGKKIILSIEDGGEGLPPSAYNLKNRSLHRFDPSRSRESGGAGLGMSIMAAVVAKLGGEFTLAPSSLGGLAVSAEFPSNR